MNPTPKKPTLDEQKAAIAKKMLRVLKWARERNAIREQKRQAQIQTIDKIKEEKMLAQNPSMNPPSD
ncbi:MAG: hypothetical protein NTU51_01845 [Bacteroidetes bacterium]|nr:hypothetical protein [Bacteroidota bacterium]